ncbi:hypothetical protein PHOBOS_57 [Erwinia phage vB_EamM_Phobos]|uniref:internal head protein n=1 Tax=Erwinia phage vB_EamM_Phobos TaxID=1883377 RepID=UPI00081C93F6|nr:internal head protein [Erwinia phage vB_EamM_Phobos]ANZ50247.1 hypothetical protein PHOBOS_57 [Erwinia phage vB_EamM_Phobos]
MNFMQQRAARESIADDVILVDAVDLPQDSVEGILSDVQSDTKQIDSLDADAQLMAEDGDETEATLGVLDDAQAAADGAEPEDGEDPMEVDEDMSDEAAKNVEVAQESIRRRWFPHKTSVAQESFGATHRRTAVRESLWDTIKQFLKNAVEWIKAQFRKLKDRWLKFSNKGKSIQKKSKAFDAAIRKLGAKKKEDISGAFIKQLSEGKSFKGEDTGYLNAQLTGAIAFQKAQGDILEGMAAVMSKVDSSPSAATVNTQVDAVNAEFGRDIGGSHSVIGGKFVKIEASESDGELATVSLVDDEAEAASEVKTPSTSTMHNVNTFFNKLGIEIEKRVKAYHDNEKKADKYRTGIEKILKRVDTIKVGEDKDLEEAVRKLRVSINGANSAVSFTERTVAHVLSTLTAGVNGFLGAAIGAYDKSKS